MSNTTDYPVKSVGINSFAVSTEGKRKTVVAVHCFQVGDLCVHPDVTYEKWSSMKAAVAECDYWIVATWDSGIKVFEEQGLERALLLAEYLSPVDWKRLSFMYTHGLTKLPAFKMMITEAVRLHKAFKATYPASLSLYEYALLHDKYIDLANAMELTRQDWSQGFYLVEDAIDRFKIESEQDKEIEAEIHAILNDPEQTDGRVFRDMNWNYTCIYGLADQRLLRMFKKGKGASDD